MSPPLWVEDLATAFWTDAGGPEPFPRNLRRAIARALPVTIVLLPALRLAGVDAWLRRNRVPCGLDVPDRPLRACLIARLGQAFIFVDGTDPEDEQRFSLAHEIAHFLNDYRTPRQRACERLDPEVLAIFDGERPPRMDESIRAVIAGVPLGAYVHLMERTADGHATRADIDIAEHAADRLAFELLAPSDLVLDGVAHRPSAERRPSVERLLRTVYALPAVPAATYADLLAPLPPATPLLRRLGLST